MLNASAQAYPIILMVRLIRFTMMLHALCCYFMVNPWSPTFRWRPWLYLGHKMRTHLHKLVFVVMGLGSLGYYWEIVLIVVLMLLPDDRQPQGLQVIDLERPAKARPTSNRGDQPLTAEYVALMLSRLGLNIKDDHMECHPMGSIVERYTFELPEAPKLPDFTDLEDYFYPLEEDEADDRVKPEPMVLGPAPGLTQPLMGGKEQDEPRATITETAPALTAEEQQEFIALKLTVTQDGEYNLLTGVRQSYHYSNVMSARKCYMTIDCDGVTHAFIGPPAERKAFTDKYALQSDESVFVIHAKFYNEFCQIALKEVNREHSKTKAKGPGKKGWTQGQSQSIEAAASPT